MCAALVSFTCVEECWILFCYIDVCSMIYFKWRPFCVPVGYVLIAFFEFWSLMVLCGMWFGFEECPKHGFGDGVFIYMYTAVAA